MQKNQPRTMVKKRRDGGIMVWSPRGARAGRRERNTAFYWLRRRLIFGDLSVIFQLVARDTFLAESYRFRTERLPPQQLREQ